MLTKLFTTIESRTIFTIGKSGTICRSRGESERDISRLTFTGNASSKWITAVSIWTAADWIMVDYFANGTFCARSRRTRIYAFLLNACFVLWTIGTDYTFSPAIRWHANITRLARTHRVLIDFVANTVWTTHMGRTYICYRRWYGCYKGMDSVFCFRYGFQLVYFHLFTIVYTFILNLKQFNFITSLLFELSWFCTLVFLNERDEIIISLGLRQRLNK